MKVLIIIPAFNEKDSITEVVSNIKKFVQKQENQEIQFDYIVINDGSIDDTESVCRVHGIDTISLMSNLGIGGAVQTGYKYAEIKGYDIAVQFDGDGQHDIASMCKLIFPLLNNECDLVVGSRFIDNFCEFRSTMARRIGIKLLSSLIRVCTGVCVLDVTSGYRAANKQVISLFAKYYPIDYPEPESLVLLARNSHRILEIPVNMFERQLGQSSIGIFSSFIYMVKVSLAILCTSFQKKVGR